MKYSQKKKQYTWRKFNSIKQSRLDYFLISESLLSEVNNANIDAGYRSDHSIANIGLKKVAAQSKRAKQYWKFNNSLLRDKNYVNTIKQLVLDVKKQYALPVYNYDNIGSVLNSELLFTINDQLFFETLLMEIRGRTISYASFKKKKENIEEEQLNFDIQDLESRDSLSDELINILEVKRNNLKLLREKKLEGMLIRSRCQWIHEGEKPSKYFCNLENRNFINKRIFFLENDGRMIFDEQDIINETKLFYANLYQRKDTKEVCLDSLINRSPKLTQEEMTQLEGLITYREALSQLKNMKNNKSPGSDGFTAEFYKFFFIDIGDFLVRSLNYGFSIGQLSVTQRQGIITCIPKEDKPKQFLKNWRPISLLNTAYKIASACIANRIKGVLNKLIHSDQKGFMKGRYIGDNIRLIYDILEYTNSRNIPGLLLFIDFEKAFDSISWAFLNKTLNFFNFGDNIKKWVQTFYNDIKTCVSINGQYSQWFDIERGVRQGDPLSPYLYLLCAEILSILLRQNNKIKGLKLNNFEYKLSQFADDTALCLDGSEESFTEAIQILQFYADLSGLKMNYEKTQVVWIGCRKKCGIKYLRDMNFCWDPGTFRYLGISFSVDVDQIVQLNYENKMDDINKILHVWNKRYLTPFGKITVLKTLVLSKLVFLFLNIPDPPDQLLKDINNMCFKFLWSGKQSKINKRTMCQAYKNGGLKMLDLYSTLTALKISWLRRISVASESPLKSLVHSLFPAFGQLPRLGVEYVNIIMQDNFNAFWRDVLKHYKRLCSKCLPTISSEFKAEPIFYNVNILVGNHIVFLKDWLRIGIYQIKHILNENGGYLKLEEFKLKFPDIQINFLKYRGLIEAIKKFQRKANITLTLDVEQQLSRGWKAIHQGNKQVTDLLLHENFVPPSINKWNNTFDNLEWNKIFNNCHRITKDCQLKWFQLRLVYRILPTNKFLFTRKIIDSSKCSICDKEDETIVHLLWQCEYVLKFWNDLLQVLKTTCIHLADLVFSPLLVLFGVKDNAYPDEAISFIILIAKFFIYKCKWNQDKPEITVFFRFLKYRYALEKNVYMKNYQLLLFTQIWQPYQKLLFHIL